MTDPQEAMAYALREMFARFKPSGVLVPLVEKP